MFPSLSPLLQNDSFFLSEERKRELANLSLLRQRPSRVYRKGFNGTKDILFLFYFLTAVLGAGCVVKAAVEPIKSTSFLINGEKLQKPLDTPFDLAWASPDIESREFETVLIRAVRTDLIDPDKWTDSVGTFITSRETYIRKINELADYIQKALTTKFNKHEEKGANASVEPGIPFEAASPPPSTAPSKPPGAENLAQLILSVDRTLVVELSISEVNFGDPLLYGGLLAVPVPGVANLSTTLKSSSLTYEARFTDQTSGEVIMELRDRRFPQVKIIDVNRLTVTSALHEIADAFAEDLVASLYRKEGQKIGKHSPFSLLPW